MNDLIGAILPLEMESKVMVIIANFFEGAGDFTIVPSCLKLKFRLKIFEFAKL